MTACDNFDDIMEHIFRSHEDVVYIAILNDELNVVTQKGFIDLHPSKLHMLHVQASLLVNMSSSWPKSLGTLEYTCASLNNSEIMVMPLPDKLHLVAVISCIQSKDTSGTRSDIAKQLRSARVRP